MRIEPFHWKITQPLVDAYIHQFSKVEQLFDYNPWESDSYIQRAKWLDQQQSKRVDREALADVLLRFNLSVGNDDAAAQSIEALRDPHTLVVTGGQQAGLFTGPLYVIYKAITTIQSAELASRALNRKVVPLFWIAGEDHDIDEVNHTYVLDKDASIQKIKVTTLPDERTSVSRLQINKESWLDAIQQLRDGLIETEYTASLMDQLTSFGEQSTTLVQFFARCMSWLFQSTGLILLDSDDPAIRQLETRMFSQLVARHREISEAIVEGTDHLRQLSFSPQVEVREENVNLFYFEQGERLLLQVDEQGYITDRKGKLRFTDEELLQHVEQEPQNFSNNVLTRPIMQDYLLPVLGVVLGPGEIAYWAQTKKLFAKLAMKMPIIIPRLEVTLLEGTVQKHMGKYNLSLEDVLLNIEEKKKQWLHQQDTIQLPERFDEVKAQISTLYAPLIELIAQVNPGLRKLGETNLQKITEQIQFLESRSTDAFQSQFDASIRQFERIRLAVIPFDKKQERVYNVFPYLNKYGDEWLKYLIKEIQIADGEHRIFYF